MVSCLEATLPHSCFLDTFTSPYSRKMCWTVFEDTILTNVTTRAYSCVFSSKAYQLIASFDLDLSLKKIFINVRVFLVWKCRFVLFLFSATTDYSNAQTVQTIWCSVGRELLTRCMGCSSPQRLPSEWPWAFDGAAIVGKEKAETPGDARGSLVLLSVWAWQFETNKSAESKVGRWLTMHR